MADYTNNSSIFSGTNKSNAPASAYYPKQATPMPVEMHSDNTLPPKTRIDLGFQDLMNTQTKKQGMDDSGR